MGAYMMAISFAVDQNLEEQKKDEIHDDQSFLIMAETDKIHCCRLQVWKKAADNLSGEVGIFDHLCLWMVLQEVFYHLLYSLDYDHACQELGILFSFHQGLDIQNRSLSREEGHIHLYDEEVQDNLYNC